MNAPSVAVRDRRGGLRFPAVAAGFVLLLVVGVISGILLHRRYVAFERVAARHVPDDAALVVRWDVEKVSLFEPTRRYLLPLLELGATKRDASSETRRRRVARELGLDIGRDLREVVAFTGPEPRDWVVVLGGSFPEAASARTISELLEREGFRWQGRPGEVFVSPAGIALARADDGAFVIASSEVRARAALPARGVPPGLLRTGAGSLVLRSAAGAPAEVRNALAAVEAPSELRGTLDWAKPLAVELVLVYRGAPPADAAARLQALAGRLWPERPPPELVVSGPDSQSPRELHVSFGLDDDSLKSLANFLARRLDPSGQPERSLR